MTAHYTPIAAGFYKKSSNNKAINCRYCDQKIYFATDAQVQEGRVTPSGLPLVSKYGRHIPLDIQTNDWHSLRCPRRQQYQQPQQQQPKPEQSNQEEGEEPVVIPLGPQRTRPYQPREEDIENDLMYKLISKRFDLVELRLRELLEEVRRQCGGSSKKDSDSQTDIDFGGAE
jgi:hypothetical protein